MNSFQRVMGTLMGKPVDRVPALAVLGAYGGRLTGTDLKTLYCDAGAWVAGQRAIQQTFGFDMVLATFDFPALAEAFGAEVAWFDNGPPNIRRHPVRIPAEALKLPLPHPRTVGRLPVILEATRRLTEEYREQVPVFAAVPGPCAIPGLLMGLETWLETFLFDQPTADALLERAGRFFLDWTHALFEAGATGLVMAEAFANADVLTRDLFAGRLLPYVRDLLGRAGGPMVFHHGGGSLRQVLDLIPGLPNVIGVGVGTTDDLSEARRLIGPDLALLGNYDGLCFSDASVGDIRKRILDCLRKGAPGGKYLLCNAGPDLPMATPPENLHAVMEACREFSAKAGVENA